jgi:phosphatidylethanolamine/phosphatidyl-N-methylethanolamine N-methyltransferase
VNYWESQALRYDRWTLRLCSDFEHMARAVADSVASSETVLEVAAGTGLVTRVAAKGPRRYIATDMNQPMLDILRARLGDTEGLEVRTGDALDLDVDDDSMDAVVCCNLLHLLPEPDACLRELTRVLRPGGTLVAPTFCHGHGVIARTVSMALGLTGFPIQTRFKGTQLDELVGARVRVDDARWFDGMLPIRFVRGVKG